MNNYATTDVYKLGIRQKEQISNLEKLETSNKHLCLIAYQIGKMGQTAALCGAHRGDLGSKVKLDLKSGLDKHYNEPKIRAYGLGISQWWACELDYLY